MRNLLFSALLIPLLVSACSSSSSTGGDAGMGDASSDSATCTGLPPLVCDGCCGRKYAADACLDGTWACRPLGEACAICDAGVTDSGDDASEDASACVGNPPVVCDGCCGTKYAADECLNGAWSCRPNPVSCPICGAETKDSATEDASSEAGTCTGTAPLCFGNDTSHCCGNDPAGSASCNGGKWMCGSSLAPGCNGTSCLLHDAGPG